MTKITPFLWLALVTLSACSYRVEKEGTTSTIPLNMGFAEAQTILGPKCSKCHSEWIGNYEEVASRAQEIGARIASADADFMMPPPNRGSLSAEEKAALLEWIAKGAPRTGATPDPGQPSQPPAPPAPPPAEPPPTEPAPTPNPPEPLPPGEPAPPPVVNFALVQEKVFTPKCARCHRNLMASYERVKADLKSIGERIVDTDPEYVMPPPGRGDLTEEERALVLGWIQAGAPEK